MTNKSGKITKEGQNCRKCGTPVIRKKSNGKNRDKKAYYWTSYLFCPFCECIYFIESEKVYNDKSKESELKLTTTLPNGKLGAHVETVNGDKGFIHVEQTDANGNYYVYPYRDEFKIEVREFKVKSYF